MKKVSFIMGIYNCADSLPRALDSLLAQSYRNWELVLCDDGSADSTYQIAETYQKSHPQHIILLRNDKNKGLNYTLNRCLQAATGELIARQDGDDHSDPLRLEKEVAALEQNPHIAFVSCAMSLFDEEGIWGATHPLPFPAASDLVRGTPFAHAPCMIRADILRQVGGYSEGPRLMRVEDYHLWYKVYLAGFCGMNLPEVLYHCEDDRKAAKRRKFRYRFNECYVRWLVFRDLKPGFRFFPTIFKPILVGLLPHPVYQALHRRNLPPAT